MLTEINKNRLKQVLDVYEQIGLMYSEYKKLVAQCEGYSGEGLAPDVFDDTVRELIKRRANWVFDADYACAVARLIDELVANSGRSDFDQAEWICRYIRALPSDPLEALCYDQLIVKGFRGELG